MKSIISAIRQMIDLSDDESGRLLSYCVTKTFAPKQILARQGEVANEIFFIEKGFTRSVILDPRGEEHTIHFSFENQFVCDYSSFMMKAPANNSVQAIEQTEVIIMPRPAVEWGYDNLRQGDRLGRLIAEFYFLYFDSRIKNQYLFSPAERYDSIAKVFPNIHNRAPQRMIASYLGISPEHLSRLKKQSIL